VHVSDDGFDGRVIDGSIQELHEILLGQGEKVSEDFSGFVVIETDQPQEAVMISKGGNIKKVVIEEQSPEGFAVKDESNEKFVIAAEDLKKRGVRG